ncbi:MAG: peptide chain release factor N(5)-glutamine methyltransferase, partial [Rubrivivax sp.]|nr:peptide chain release factor N(5)-glutamine methyltransferase [Rubrivivax sp.]
LKIKNLKLKIARRMRGEPLAYILGEKEFYGLRFKVNKNVLIPRPETELIVEQALRKIQETPKSLTATGQVRNNNQTIIDLGTGSGNIIIAIAKKMGFFENENYGLRFLATDISTSALRVAKQNAKLNKVDKKIKFIKGNLLEPILKSQISNLKSQIIIIANLPYLSKKIYNSTMPDVKNYEPKSALLSGTDGLNHYRKLFSQIKKLLTANGSQLTVFLEISSEQKIPLQKIISKEFPESKTTFYKDLARKWRVCEVNI